LQVGSEASLNAQRDKLRYKTVAETEQRLKTRKHVKLRNI